MEDESEVDEPDEVFLKHRLQASQQLQQQVELGRQQHMARAMVSSGRQAQGCVGDRFAKVVQPQGIPAQRQQDHFQHDLTKKPPAASVYHQRQLQFGNAGRGGKPHSPPQVKVKMQPASNIKKVAGLQDFTKKFKLGSPTLQ